MMNRAYCTGYFLSLFVTGEYPKGEQKIVRYFVLVVIFCALAGFTTTQETRNTAVVHHAAYMMVLPVYLEYSSPMKVIRKKKLFLFLHT
ncbi:MAG: hypothetical protein M1148_02405 [Candidatus Thermoplasmatota archaeon]|jgi:hypothetical protein|nr:hypothetical protein [Candidatus Thermoplasmatota archaeon]